MNSSPILFSKGLSKCRVSIAARNAFTSKNFNQQIRSAHGSLPHPTRKLTSTSLSKPYAIWAIAALFVAIGASKQLENSREKKIFDPPRFTPFNITKREEASSTSIILTVRPRTVSANEDGDIPDPYKEEWEKGTWSVEMKQPQLQIARRYTPLPPSPDTPRSDLRFLIRKEHKGEMSGYLHTLHVGAEIGLRGPHTEFALPKDVNNVVFLAAGTGIAPALQLAHTLFGRDDSKTKKLHIVWSNRRREDCAGGDSAAAKGLIASKRSRIVAEIEGLQDRFPGQFSIDYLIDEEGRFLDAHKISQVTKISSTSDDRGTNLMLISGPDGFINHFAGPKKWEAGKEMQGSLGGILAQMRLKDWHIWKL